MACVPFNEPMMLLLYVFYIVVEGYEVFKIWDDFFSKFFI